MWWEWEWNLPWSSYECFSKVTFEEKKTIAYFLGKKKIVCVYTYICIYQICVCVWLKEKLNFLSCTVLMKLWFWNPVSRKGNRKIRMVKKEKKNSDCKKLYKTSVLLISILCIKLPTLPESHVSCLKF